jgi:nuclear mRNA export protein SAC3
MPDPEVRYRLDEAITIKGTCEDMCPELERHEREAQALLDPWEYVSSLFLATYTNQ